MALYEVANRETGERARVEAPYAQDACGRMGWLIGHCHVRMLREEPGTDPDARPEWLVDLVKKMEGDA
jgi:hypothetical protein